jgi:hypothetical protein
LVREGENTGGWIKLHRPNELIICALRQILHYYDDRGKEFVMGRRHEGNKETTWKPWRRWEDNIEMSVDLTHVAQNSVQWRALVNTAVNLRIP